MACEGQARSGSPSEAHADARTRAYGESGCGHR